MSSVVAAANEDNANTDAELNEFNAVVIGANIDTEIDCTHFFFIFSHLQYNTSATSSAKWLNEV
jgi:hypothetical protein